MFHFSLHFLSLFLKNINYYQVSPMVPRAPEGGLTLKFLKIEGGGVNSSDLMNNFWRIPQNFVRNFFQQKS
jgi:hypothetical protein